MMMIEAYKFSVLYTWSAYSQKNPINYHLRVKRGNTEYNAALSLTESHCLYIFFSLFVLQDSLHRYQGISNSNSNVLHYSLTWELLVFTCLMSDETYVGIKITCCVSLSPRWCNDLHLLIFMSLSLSTLSQHWCIWVIEYDRRNYM